MIIAFATFAWGHNVSPALFTPSTGPGDPEIDVLAGAYYQASPFGNALQSSQIAVSARADRFAVGATTGLGTALPYGASGWLGFALVDRERVRVQVFGEVGSVVGAGLSVVAELGGGIGGHGVRLDLAWGPAWSLPILIDPGWQGPLDITRSMPELGMSVPLHPAGTMFLRAGLVGTIPTTTFRLDTRGERRGGFLLEASLGSNGYGGVASLAMGFNGF